MNIRTLFIANAKATILMQPRVSSFYYPTRFAKAASIEASASAYKRDDATVRDFFSMRI